jgi:hypothetical protein
MSVTDDVEEVISFGDCSMLHYMFSSLINVCCLAVTTVSKFLITERYSETSISRLFCLKPVTGLDWNRGMALSI